MKIQEAEKENRASSTLNYRQGFEVTTYFVSPKDTTQLPYSEPNDMSRRLLSL